MHRSARRPSLEIRSHNGFAGVYALQRIAPSDRLIPVSGEERETPSRHSIQIAADRHVHPADTHAVWRFLNHACRPNLAFDAEGRCFVALRAIAPNEELTFNYVTTEWDMAEGFECRCGDRTCLGRVVGFKHLAPAMQQQLLPYVAPHIEALHVERHAAEH